MTSELILARAKFNITKSLYNVVQFTAKHLRWLLKQARDHRTKTIIQQWEKKVKLAKNRNAAVFFNVTKRFPLRLGNWKIWLNEENPFYSIKAYTGIFRENEHCKVPDFPSKNDSTILDIGANEGFFTLRVREMAPEARIIAVEPNISAFRVLKKNVESNRLKNIIIINKAITSRTGKIVFEIVRGHTSVGGLRVYKKYRHKGQLKRIIVPSITLERLCKLHAIKSIDLLKMDVEGSELEILESSRKILPNVKKVVVEYHENRKSVKGLMVKNNFTVKRMERKKYCGDIYFRNNFSA